MMDRTALIVKIQAKADDVLDIIQATKEAFTAWAADPDSQSSQIVDRLNNLAAREGEFEVLTMALAGLRSEQQPDESKKPTAKDVWDFLVQTYLLTSPRDTWSGRTNDLVRAKVDGQRDAMNWLRWEMMVG